MRWIRLGRSLLGQAEARLKDACGAREDGNHPYAVRLSQECVELSLKGVLRAVGIEYPKVHEVSDVFLRVPERFPDWFRVEIGFIRESSKMLYKKREPSLYGDEVLHLSPNEVMDEGDAADALSRAEKIYGLCRRFIDEALAGRDRSAGEGAEKVLDSK
ncbi:HEPN domain-containing protein [Candidatus Bathyarchaeota archaeon]|nr:HEPN domain-containing protein [Candidatus Bathyarchaeota archaeon]